MVGAWTPVHPSLFLPMDDWDYTDLSLPEAQLRRFPAHPTQSPELSSCPVRAEERALHDLPILIYAGDEHCSLESTWPSGGFPAAPPNAHSRKAAAATVKPARLRIHSQNLQYALMHASQGNWSHEGSAAVVGNKAEGVIQFPFQVGSPAVGLAPLLRLYQSIEIAMACPG